MNVVMREFRGLSLTLHRQRGAFLTHNRTRPSMALSTMKAKAPETEESSKKGLLVKDDATKDVETNRTKMTKLFRKYGKLGVFTYFGIYYTTLFSIWAGLDYGIIGTFGYEPTIAIEKMISSEEWLTGNHNVCDRIFGEVPSARMGRFAIAYGLAKTTEPLRVGATFIIVPFLDKMLGRKTIVEAEKENAVGSERGSGSTHK